MTMIEVRDDASSKAILADAPLWSVRPADQPVPPHLGRGVLARTFARWVRMRDDAERERAKAAIDATLERFEPARIERETRVQSKLAFTGGWDHWIWATSICTMAALLGLPPRDLGGQRALVASFHAIARGLAPAATADQVLSADAACAELLERVAVREVRSLDVPDPTDELPNRVALLWQSFEAGAALLGKATVALADDAKLRTRGSMSTWLPRWIQTNGVLLNTRRFARADTNVGGQTVRRGEGVIVPLRGHAFGSGAHGCPGERIAMTIASTALETVLAGNDVRWPTPLRSLNLPNANIPIFQEDPR